MGQVEEHQAHPAAVPDCHQKVGSTRVGGPQSGFEFRGHGGSKPLPGVVTVDRDADGRVRRRGELDLAVRISIQRRLAQCKSAEDAMAGLGRDKAISHLANETIRLRWWQHLYLVPARVRARNCFWRLAGFKAGTAIIELFWIHPRQHPGRLQHPHPGPVGVADKDFLILDKSAWMQICLIPQVCVPLVGIVRRTGSSNGRGGQERNDYHRQHSQETAHTIPYMQNVSPSLASELELFSHLGA